ncbi:DUF6438 domain-containing protein [Flavobacterium taihuense]|uniref:DUF6438 domain-containing protein n=1 Tax=Flavobacterium taihuense TaxID=2857508 RepID=A0ABS6Y0K6_9FLAO|nr:DUF6438 domain-containing protein [Flavobacterium taihuense]MBW4362451.1 hypothetical protein [Flavobacterium taihuense]
MTKFTIILTFIFSNIVFGNKIDNLKTTKDVIEFVKTVYPEYGIIRYKDFKYGIFDINSTDSIYSQLKCKEIFRIDEIKNWQKIDINNDGLTDLIFISHFYGYTQNVIIDKGKNEFKLIRNIINFDECEYIKPIKIQDKNQLRIRKVNLPFDFDDNIEKYIKIDTLTYKYDSFIELNDKVIIDNKIKSIEIKTNFCFGDCPVFKLTINKNGVAQFDGIEFTKFKGKSTKQLNQKIVDEIFDLINYIEIKKLNDYYEVNYTDASTANLDIFFEDGSIKKIKDYGLSGTYGLSALYSKLTQLGTETEWE